MPDNWSFVIAAYALTAIVLALYWRSLNRRERDATPRKATSRPRRPAPASRLPHAPSDATATSSLHSPPRS